MEPKQLLELLHTVHPELTPEQTPWFRDLTYTDGDDKVNTAIDIPADSGQPIAPLIFISLIENAFKHGISPTQPSFIDIHFWLNKGCVECETTNTNFPKSRGDKSGSGIGLEQIQRRLELSYAGHYLWQKGPSPDGTTYHSRLIIETLSDSKKATLTSS